MYKIYYSAMIIMLLVLSGCKQRGHSMTAMIKEGPSIFVAQRADRVPDKFLEGRYKVGAPYKINQKWYYPRHEPDYEQVGVASWYGPGFHGKKTANGAVFNQRALTAAHRTLPMPSLVRVTNLENHRSVVLLVTDRGPYASDRIIDVSEKASEVLGFKKGGTAKVKVKYLDAQTNEFLLAHNIVPEINENRIKVAKAIEKMKRSPSHSVIAARDYLDTGFDSKPVKLTVPHPIRKVISPEITQASAVVNPGVGTSKEFAGQSIVYIDDPNSAASKKALLQATYTKDLVQDAALHYVQAGSYQSEANAVRAANILGTLGKVNIASLDRGKRPLYRVRLGPLYHDNVADTMLEKVVALGFKDAIVVQD